MPVSAIRTHDDRSQRQLGMWMGEDKMARAKLEMHRQIGNLIRPRNIVAIQLKICTAVGIAMTPVIIPKKASTSAPAPIVKK